VYRGGRASIEQTSHSLSGSQAVTRQRRVKFAQPTYALYYYTVRPSQPATILWGGPLPAAAPRSACSDAWKSRTWESGADEGVRHTFGCG
jgi:hypothetical protein